MLGGLGLLLGTFGIAVVLLRNVLERRGELTLLSAVGFRRSAVRHLILLETASLIALGLLVGAATALVAVAPNAIDSPGRIPWLSLAGTLALILVIGVVAAALAARSAVRGDLIESLRAG
jgi:ABC-type antimicrobial peptide transport system permease subunit